jgi:hypothetical protein
MRRAVALLAAGCAVVTDADEADRLDGDRDGYPFASDCNDGRDDVGALDLSDDQTRLTCGDEVESDDIASEPNWLEYVPCLHPGLPGDLVQLPEHDRVMVFRSPQATGVLLTLLGDGLVMGGAGGDRTNDNQDVGLVVNRGRSCGVDRCAVGLPPRPEGTAEWRPTVDFYAQADEPWAVVVSGESGPWRLSVDCSD